MGVRGAVFLGLTLSILHGVLCGDLEVQYPVSGICALKGSSVFIPCTYVYPNNARVTERKWFKNGNANAYDNVKYIYHSGGISLDTDYTGRVEYIGPDKNCTLKVRDLRSTDIGWYFFRIIIDRSPNAFTRVPGVHLNITDQPLKVTMMSTGSDEIILGDNVTLTCNTQSCSPNQTEFTWFKDGRPTYNTTSNPLSFNNVSYEHFGNYSCASKDNTSVQSPQITLDVKYAPKNTSVSVSPSGEIVEGSSVTLTCSSNANPPVQNYTWFKTNGAAVWEKGSGQSFTITEISSGDSGQYYCEAQNKHGAHNSTAVSVTVAGKLNLALILSVSGTVLFLSIVAVVVVIVVNRRKPGPSGEKTDTGTQGAAEIFFENTAISQTLGGEKGPSVAAPEEDLNYAAIHFQAKTPVGNGSTKPEEDDPSVIYSAVKGQS
ncbi:B-cell receptor CD22 [Amia ocellicauda]|uniref:B-cell receptor CD22 n=1 Tax=Amia ocellicauda TaxID=2972642 RepID=UPI003464B110